MADLDRIVHEPVRLRILSVLTAVESADFNFLLTALGVTRGNLSVHADKLEQAEYIAITKGYNGKIPRTHYAITNKGRQALEDYWKTLDAIRARPIEEPTT
jgi:DNA-binding MarR family transcriptional regulator